MAEDCFFMKLGYKEFFRYKFDHKVAEKNAKRAVF